MGCGASIIEDLEKATIEAAEKEARLKAVKANESQGNPAENHEVIINKELNPNTNIQGEAPKIIKKEIRKIIKDGIEQEEEFQLEEPIQ